MDMDVIYNPNLALYLPLWKRDGAAFRSDDGYGHLFTVTDAPWGIQGRSFAGAGFIKATASLFSAYPFTIGGWIYPTSHTDLSIIISIANDATFNQWCQVGITASTGYGVVQIRNTTAYSATGSTNLYNGWHLVMGVFESATSRLLYVDGQYITNSTDSANYPTLSNAVVIGREADNTPSGDAEGIIGEAYGWASGFTAPENQNLWLATKERYQ